MPRCLGRLVSEKVRGQFRDGHYFHIELRCEKDALEDEKLCQKCLERPRTQHRTHATCLHGYIGGEIPPWSHLFGSAWYLSKVELYGQPSDEEMVRVKKAIQENLGIDTKESTEKPSAVPIVPTVPIVPIVTVPVKKKAPRKLKLAATEQVPPPEPPPIVEAPVTTKTTKMTKPKAPRKPRVKKVIPDTIVPEVSAVPLAADVKAVEVFQPVEIISEDDILVIRLKPMDLNGTSYLVQSSKDKVYTVPKEGHLPTYVGRWNREDQVLDRDFPDSDHE